MGRDSRGGAREHRPHRPHELGPRIVWRGRWAAADLRPWGGGRVTLRNPSARGWPDRGGRTEDEETARRWSWAYVDLYREGRKREQLGLRAKSRPIGPLREKWIAHRERQKRARKTIEGGSTATGHLQDWIGKDTPIEDVDARTLQSLFDSFLDAGYRPSTLDTMRRQLSSFFEFAEIAPNPAARGKIELPDQTWSDARAWTNEEILRIRNHADQIGRRFEVELALGTGGRLGELLALDRRDFSDERKTVRFVRQISQDGSLKKRLKGKRARTAVVLPSLWEFLPESSGPLLQEDGAHIKPRRAHDIIAELLEGAGVKEVGAGWHRFRHTYARMYLELGGWIDELQRSLGHASLKTTERTYGHFAPERAASFAVSRIYGSGRHLRAI